MFLSLWHLYLYIAKDIFIFVLEKNIHIRLILNRNLVQILTFVSLVTIDKPLKCFRKSQTLILIYLQFVFSNYIFQLKFRNPNAEMWRVVAWLYLPGIDLTNHEVETYEVATSPSSNSTIVHHRNCCLWLVDPASRPLRSRNCRWVSFSRKSWFFLKPNCKLDSWMAPMNL